jgi:hypothetical protein
MLYYNILYILCLIAKSKTNLQKKIDHLTATTVNIKANALPAFCFFMSAVREGRERYCFAFLWAAERP